MTNVVNCLLNIVFLTLNNPKWFFVTYRGYADVYTANTGVDSIL